MIVAPFDLSTELGVSGQTEAVKRIEAAASKAGIPLGCPSFSKESTQQLVAKGYRIIGGFDILWLKNAVAQSQNWLRSPS